MAGSATSRRVQKENILILVSSVDLPLHHSLSVDVDSQVPLSASQDTDTVPDTWLPGREVESRGREAEDLLVIPILSD